MATSTARLSRSTIAAPAVVPAAYAVGVLCLAGEAVVHVQQFVSLFYAVRWIGPLFILNAVALAVVIAGICYRPTRRLAGLAGVLIAALALASLIISYGTGLFGWQEVGLRTPIALAVILEVGAILALAAALALPSSR